MTFIIHQNAIKSKYKKINELGKGASGTVYKVYLYKLALVRVNFFYFYQFKNVEIIIEFIEPKHLWNISLQKIYICIK